MIAPEVSRRHLHAQLVVWIVYVGIPVIFLTSLTVIGVRSNPVRWMPVLIPLGAFAAGWYLRGQWRYRVQTWSPIGAVMGGLTGFFTALYTANDPLYFLLGGAVGAFAGYLVGRHGERLLLHPLDVGLAETPYQVILRLRGIPRVRVAIDDTAIQLMIRVRTTNGRKTSYTEESVDVPLEELAGASVRYLSGSEDLVYPIWSDQPPVASPGPALVVQTSADEWILPHDDAVVLGQIIDRRIARLRSTQ
ncbi:glycine zipper domain-containing protein [Kribbella sp. NBC_01505]|uniref:hypothetical protein n=1 Tax=Kribbella sp. NBC_01505 TaxID=2903580 RepID=UPI00386B0B19